MLTSGIVRTGVWLQGETVGVSIGVVVTMFTALFGYKRLKEEGDNGSDTTG